MINDLLYLEVTGYKTLPFSAQNALGTDRPDCSATSRHIGARHSSRTGVGIR
jgi:hypothetical protein